MTRCVPVTVETLSNDQIADLRKIKADPRHRLPPIRRRMFLRLRLILPAESTPAPSERRRQRKPKRVHKLTDVGMKVLGAAL